MAITVSDVEASAEWYERVLGLQRLPAPIPHHGNESPGFALLLLEPSAAWAIVSTITSAIEVRSLTRHVRAWTTSAWLSERRDLDDWVTRLDALGVSHSGVTDTADPIPYSALVFRDPDNIQLEFVHLPS